MRLPLRQRRVSFKSEHVERRLHGKNKKGWQNRFWDAQELKNLSLVVAKTYDEI